VHPTGTERHSIYTVSWRSLPYAELVAKVDRALRLDWVRRFSNGDEGGTIYGKGISSGSLFGRRSGGCPPCGGGKADSGRRGGFGIDMPSEAEPCREVAPHRLRLSHHAPRGVPRDFEVAMKSRAWLERATDDDYDRFLEKLGPEVGVSDYASWRGIRFFEAETDDPIAACSSSLIWARLGGPHGSSGPDRRPLRREIPGMEQDAERTSHDWIRRTSVSPATRRELRSFGNRCRRNGFCESCSPREEFRSPRQCWTNSFARVDDLEPSVRFCPRRESGSGSESFRDLPKDGCRDGRRHRERVTDS